MKIMKSFSFCYGHRIWNQELSDNQICKWRYCHGHQGRVDIVLSRPVTHRGMVLDFNELKCIKGFSDSVLDHKFLMDVNDPLVLEYLKILNCSLDDIHCNGSHVYSYGKIMKKQNKEFLQELCDSLVILQREPTSENLCLFLKHQVEEMLFEVNQKIHAVNNNHVVVESVRWWEGETSYAEC